MSKGVTTSDPQNPPPPAAATRARPLVGLLTVLAACMGLRVWLICHTDAISRDGTIYIRMARQWPDDPAGVVQTFEYHVGYPVAVHWVHRLVLALGVTPGPPSWDLAGQAVSFTAAMGATVAIWLFAAMTFNWRVAWVGALLFTVGRKWTVIGADVVSDALAVCLQMWAVTLGLAVVGLLRRKSRWSVLAAAGVGVCAGCGYLVRPEALFTAAFVILVWLAWQCYRRVSWRLTLASACAAGVATAACAAPYVLAIGGLTKKKSLWNIFRSLFRSVGLPIASTGAGGDYGGGWKLVGQCFEAFHPVVAVLVCVWLVTWLGVKVLRLKLPAEVRIFPRRPGGLIMILVLVSFSAALLGIYRHASYLTSRHLMFPAATLAGLGGAGAVIALYWIQAFATAVIRWGFVARLVFPVGIAAFVVGLLGHSMRPVHEGNAYLRAAGLALGREPTEDRYVVADDARILHYADAQGGFCLSQDITVDRLRRHIPSGRRSWLVLRDSNVAKAPGDVAGLLRTPAFRPVRAFDQIRGGRKDDTLRIYRVDFRAPR